MFDLILNCCIIDFASKMTLFETKCVEKGNNIFITPLRLSMAYQLIKDIRYYQNNIDGNKLFEIPKSLNLVGARFSCKLRELGFETVEYHHIYLNLTSQLSHGEVEISSKERIEKWFIYVDAGISPELFEVMDDDGKFNLIVTLTTKALELLCVRDHLNTSLVKQVEKEILIYKTELEILHKLKNTKNYQVTITYQINPKGNQSTVYVTYFDKNESTKSRKLLVQLKNYEDIFFLINDIIVKNGIITLKPRKSYKASFYINSYDIPLTMTLKEMIN